MTQQVKNLRLRRTQKLLREALIELIEERGFDALTIGELTERALVSRAAFYRQYQDKYDLVEQIFAEAMDALSNDVGDRLGQDHPAEVWVKFFEHIEQYERLYRALLGRKGSPWFVMKMRASMTDLVKDYGHPPNRGNTSMHLVHTSSDEFVPDLVATMLVEAISWWLEHARPYTAKEIATRSSLLAAAIFKEASTWQ
ncbi:MAG: TetR/AcrR family transcriptional regulator [Ktedonobacteraceae bacterium]|nr:TetR/AcrR family transcriptional regulator [Ktedonobacteraceae bacterium]